MNESRRRRNGLLELVTDAAATAAAAASVAVVHRSHVSRGSGVGREPRHHVHDDDHGHVRETDADPHLPGQRRQETERAGLVFGRFLDHYVDGGRHERFTELHDLFAFRRDGERRDRHVYFLFTTRTK